MLLQRIQVTPQSSWSNLKAPKSIQQTWNGASKNRCRKHLIKQQGRKSEETPAEQLTAPVAKEEHTISEKEMAYNEFPSKRASYPGGVNALNQYLADNIKYPKDALANKTEGTVYAHIYLDQSGNKEDVEFPNPLGYGLEEEVLRVIKAMPKFIPAEDQGEPVKTKLILPVKFYLK